MESAVLMLTHLKSRLVSSGSTPPAVTYRLRLRLIYFDWREHSPSFFLRSCLILRVSISERVLSCRVLLIGLLFDYLDFRLSFLFLSLLGPPLGMVFTGGLYCSLGRVESRYFLRSWLTKLMRWCRVNTGAS